MRLWFLKMCCASLLGCQCCLPIRWTNNNLHLCAHGLLRCVVQAYQLPILPLIRWTNNNPSSMRLKFSQMCCASQLAVNTAPQSEGPIIILHESEVYLYVLCKLIGCQYCPPIRWTNNNPSSMRLRFIKMCCIILLAVNTAP